MVLTENTSGKGNLEKELSDLQKAENEKIEGLKGMIKKSDIDVSQLFRRSTSQIDSIVNEVRKSIPEKSGRTVNGTDANNFRTLWADWEQFQKNKSSFEKWVGNDIYKTKASDEKTKNYLRQNQPFERLYKTYMNLITASSEDPFFKNKTANPRNKELTKLIGTFSEMSKTAEDIQELRMKKATINEKIRSMLNAEQEEATKKRTELEKETLEEIELVRGLIAELLKDKEQKNRADDLETQKLAALLLSEEELEPYFQTCFHFRTLEEKTFEEVMKEIKESGWSEVLRNAALLPKNDANTNPMTELLKIWNQDRQMLKKYREAMEVNSKMKGLEKRTLGENMLEEESKETELQKNLKKEISNGKLVEKIMVLALAEKFKGAKGLEVIPVDSVIDIGKKVDCAIKLTSSESGKVSLVGLDITTNPNKQNQHPWSKGMNLKKSSVVKALGQDAIRSIPNLMKKNYYMKRFVVLTPTHSGFESSLIDQLYFELKNKELKDISESVVNDIYNGARKDLPKHVTKLPLTISEVIRQISETAAA
jgi:hypothetical protein